MTDIQKANNRWHEVNGNIIIKLPEDFNLKANLGYLMRSKNECMFEVENGIITRAVAIGETRALIQIHVNDHNQMIVQFLKDSRPDNQEECAAVVSYVREWFDLDRDLKSFYEMAKSDHCLKTLFKNSTDYA